MPKDNVTNFKTFHSSIATSVKRYLVRTLQGALKLKITMKGPKKEDSEKIKCEKSKRIITKKIKTNHGNKVIVMNNFFNLLKCM